MNGRKSRLARTAARAGTYTKRGEVRCTASHDGLVGRCPACKAEV